MNGTLFIYHGGGCFDGFTAAWTYSRFVDREAEFYPAKYGDAPPDVRGRDVIIADFSYPREVMFRVACDANNLTMLDHHATAQEALDGLERQVLNETGKTIRVVFDMGRSGAGIVWDELVGRATIAATDCVWCGGRVGELHRGGCCVVTRPTLVNFVEDRDLWRLAMPMAREFMANVYAAPMTFDGWDELHARTLEDMYDRGQAILAYMQEYGTKALAEARRTTWRIKDDSPGVWLVNVWSVNLPYMNCSDYLTRLLGEKGTPMVAGYFRRADGRWQFSLRSREDFDCSAVAKLFGGGGHRQASGFDVPTLSEVFAD